MAAGIEDVGNNIGVGGLSQVVLDAGVEGVGKAPLGVAAGIEDVGNNIGGGDSPTPVVSDELQVVVSAGVEGVGKGPPYVAAGVEDTGKGLEARRAERCWFEATFGDNVDSDGDDIGQAVLDTGVEGVGKGPLVVAAGVEVAIAGKTFGKGRNAGRAQAECARASGAPAVPKPSLVHDCKAQCSFGDEADCSDHGSLLLAADLPRPPEVDGSLKGAASLKHGGKGGSSCGAVPKGGRLKARAARGGGGAGGLLASDLPRPPEGKDYPDTSAHLIAIKAHLHQLLLLKSGLGGRKVDPSAVASLGKAIDAYRVLVELLQEEVSRSGNC